MIESSVVSTFKLPRLEFILGSRPWWLNKIMRSNAIVEPVKSEFSDLLKLSSNCRCTDRRDKIFGILGLATDVDELDLSADYSLSLFQLYVNNFVANELQRREWGVDSLDLDFSDFFNWLFLARLCKIWIVRNEKRA